MADDITGLIVFKLSLQRADLLLSEIDAARAKARNAVEMGERTLKEANETLQTLLGKARERCLFNLND